MQRNRVICAGIMVLGASLAFGACDSAPSSTKPSTPSASPNTPQVATQAVAKDPLTAGIQAILGQCQVLPTGRFRRCKGKPLAKLHILEQQRGQISSIAHYCDLVRSDADRQNQPLRAIAINRISHLSDFAGLKKGGTPALLRCLTSLLDKKWPEEEKWKPVTLVRPVAFLATALNKHKEFLDYLVRKAPEKVRQVGYASLWPNGRLAVLDSLAKAAKSEDVALRHAVILGFRYDKPAKDERQPVCQLLQQLLEDPDNSVQGAAALQTARTCGRDGHEAVLKAAKESIKRRGNRDMRLVNALNHIATRAGVSKTHRKKALSQLARIVSTPERPAEDEPASSKTKLRPPSRARLSALSYLEQIDPKRAAKLEKRYNLRKKAKTARRPPKRASRTRSEHQREGSPARVSAQNRSAAATKSPLLSRQ